eukprot:4313611-Amphidinium_carterae.1
MSSGALRQKRDRLAHMLLQWSRQNSDYVLSFEDAEVVVPKGNRGLWEPDELHFSPAGSQQLGAMLAKHAAHTLGELGFANGEEDDSWFGGLLSAFTGRS